MSEETTTKDKYEAARQDLAERTAILYDQQEADEAIMAPRVDESFDWNNLWGQINDFLSGFIISIQDAFNGVHPHRTWEKVQAAREARDTDNTSETAAAEKTTPQAETPTEQPGTSTPEEPSVTAAEQATPQDDQPTEQPEHTVSEEPVEPSETMPSVTESDISSGVDEPLTMDLNHTAHFNSITGELYQGDNQPSLDNNEPEIAGRVGPTSDLGIKTPAA